MVENPIKSFPGFRLRMVSQRTIGELHAQLQDLKIRLSDSSVLVLINENPGILQIQIGNELNIARANMAPIITKLKNKDLISKRREDGRSFGLYATSEGQALSRQIMEIMENHDTKILNSISEANRDAFMAGLLEINSEFRKNRKPKNS